MNWQRTNQNSKRQQELARIRPSEEPENGIAVTKPNRKARRTARHKKEQP